MHIAIINGPNLNLVGTREPSMYGSQSLSEYLSELIKRYPEHQFSLYQSNIEGELIDEIQRSQQADAIVINAGAYTHTSIAIADALRAISPKKIIEVHLSNILAREDFRHVSYIAPVCTGCISGFGLQSYHLAIQSLLLE
jgi:3-dehydroquinate dehydratase II